MLRGKKLQGAYFGKSVYRGHSRVLGTQGTVLQGNLAHRKPRPLRTLQQDYAQVLIVEGCFLLPLFF